MKIQNLGKIFLVILFSINLYANVDIKLSSNSIYKGEILSFTISASGEDIKFPKIEQIDNFNILDTSSSQSISNINGKVESLISKTYSFAPQKSVIIPAFDIEIDGKIYKTKKREIEVKKPNASKNGDDFILELKVDKNEVRVGENIKLSLIYKQKIGVKADDLRRQEPKLDNFWIKKIDGVEQYREGEYMVQKINYLLFPQKAGKYIFPSSVVLIGKYVRRKDSLFNDPFFDSFTNNLQWSKIYSNDIKLDVKPLPNNLEVYGDYSIEASVDKSEVKANEPVNLTIKIVGTGNIDDIQKFNLDIKNSVIYADEPKIKTNIINGKYGGNFMQKIAIVGQNSYTIPAINFRYFDQITKKSKTISTQAFEIKVSGVKSAKTEPKIEMNNEDRNLIKSKDENKPKVIIKKESSNLKYLTFVLGLFVGFVAFVLYSRVKNRKTIDKNNMQKSILKTKTDKELFELLLPHSKKDIEIKKALDLLEENIYSGSKHKIDKEILIDIFVQDVEGYL